MSSQTITVSNDFSIVDDKINTNTCKPKKTEKVISCDKGNTSLCKSREFSVSLVDKGDLIVHIWKLNGTLIKFNNCAQMKTGYTEEEVLGNKWISTIVPESHMPGMKEMFRLMKKGYIPQTTECKLYCKNGKDLDILWSNYIMRDEANKPFLAVSVGMDITELKTADKKLALSYNELQKTHSKLETAQKQLQRQLKEQNEIQNSLLKSEERFKLALDGSNDGIWDLDILNNRKFFYSDRCAEILDYTKEDIRRQFTSFRELIHPDDYERFKKCLSDYLTKKTPNYEIEYRVKKKNGNYIWIRVKGKAIWDENNNPIRITGSLTNIQERKLAEEAMYKLAYYDGLTELPNKAMLWKQLSEELEKSKPDNHRIALLSMDIDNFKDINDTFGHDNGDKLLNIIANRLNKLACSNVTIAKCGGDEFLVLIKAVEDNLEVVEVCKNLLREFKKPIIINSMNIHVTISIGAAIYPEDGQDEYTLLKNADIAMYNAKEYEGNKFELFNSEMNLRVLEKLELENGLKKALKNNELCLYYQPQISLETNKIVGLEALVRWQHPVKGLIPPDRFIPVAEESGLIIEIGEWVLKKACEQFIECKKLNIEPKRIAINISAKQFEQSNFVSVVKNIINKTGIDPKYIELEITESIAMKNLDYTIIVINELRKLDIKVSLDDFGTGYSSLNYLMRLPINTLKIDKSFLDNIKLNSNEELIAKTIITLAKKLNLNVIAEGVETFEQLKFLKDQNCDIAQGYLFSKPISFKEVIDILAKEK